MATEELHRNIVVVQHAIDRMRARRNGEVEDLTDKQIAGWIRREVREGIAQGRVGRHKPKVFRLYGLGKKGGLLDHEQDRCVWTKGFTLAWVVRRTAGADVVMTTLTRTRAK